MGQLHIRKIELAEMIRRTAIIVIAEPDSPPTVTEQIVIKARGKKPPPYERHVQRYRVCETLRGNLAPGAAIAVISPDDALQERLHRDYHTKGLSRHVVVDFYEPVAAPAPGQPRLLFLNSSGERYAFTIAGGAEGLTQRSEVERLLGLPTVAYAPGTRETVVDRALRTRGDFGVYGDLRVGLAEIPKHNAVKLTDVKNGFRVDIVPHDGQGHEYQFVVTLGGTIEDFMAAEAEPAKREMPESFRFRFNAVQLVKQGDTITLTVYPVWEDAQRGPPPGFEDSLSSLRLSRDEFKALYRRLQQIDFRRYASLSEKDFSALPPDLSHMEILHLAVDGRETVNWAHSAWLQNTALRAPLLTLEQELKQLASTRSHNPADFTQVRLRDVQGLYGGRNVDVASNGNAVVQVVTPTETGLHERRFKFVLTNDERKALRELLVQHPLREIRIPFRLGIPDQARPEITLKTRDGAVTTVAKWDDDRHPDFDALYDQLLRFARQTEKLKPVWEGRYDRDWQPK